MKKTSNFKYTFVVIVTCQGHSTEYEYSNLFSALIGYAKQYLKKNKYGTIEIDKLPPATPMMPPKDEGENR